jgi:hypothetical protein
MVDSATEGVATSATEGELDDDDAVLASEPQPASDMAIAAAQAPRATDEDTREKFTAATLPPHRAVTELRPPVFPRLGVGGRGRSTVPPDHRTRENVAPVSLSASITENIGTPVP